MIDEDLLRIGNIFKQILDRIYNMHRSGMFIAAGEFSDFRIG